MAFKRLAVWFCSFLLKAVLGVCILQDWLKNHNLPLWSLLFYGKEARSDNATKSPGACQGFYYSLRIFFSHFRAYRPTCFSEKGAISAPRFWSLNRASRKCLQAIRCPSFKNPENLPERAACPAFPCILQF